MVLNCPHPPGLERIGSVARVSRTIEFTKEKVMQVADIMTKDVRFVTPTESLCDAACKMKDADAGAMPVVADDGLVVGILTDRDIVVRALAQRADPGALRVEEVMSRNPVTCRPDCPIDAAADTMRRRKIRRLVVTQEHNRGVLGVVSLGDIAARAHERELVGAATEGICAPA
jgi:CBS domain-containing protein